jgi:thiopeptide-type bacteriocin biosynthesis protein
MTGLRWLAAHLYRAEPWEGLLTSAVAPFIEEVLAAGLAEQFFFIRYWELGPHIRLRFKGDPAVLANDVAPLLDRYFTEWFTLHPSHRDQPVGPDGTPADKHWLPNDTIHYSDYQPEVERYGGSVGIEIAEKQFEVSSRAVLAVIGCSPEWNYERALGAAIQLHLGFAHATGMGLAESMIFFSHVFKKWLYRSSGGSGLPQSELLERQSAVLQAFQDTFARQSSLLVPYHRTLWTGLVAGASFDAAWLNRWVLEMGAICRALYQAQDQGRLRHPPTATPDQVNGMTVSARVLWPIFESYIHMTNNRLGVRNHDEAYLGYLIMRSLEELTDIG